MKKIIITRKYVMAICCVIVGVLLGKWIFTTDKDVQTPHQHHHSDPHHQSHSTSDWTCSMHPQIHQDHPGKCPICGMDLVEQKSNVERGLSEAMVNLSDEAEALANIQTVKVGKMAAAGAIRLLGTIQPDERRTQTVAARVSGRIERLLVNYTGQHISVGQTLAQIYSPELYSAQQELLEASRLSAGQPQLLEAATEKLRLWNMSDSQIHQIVNRGRAQSVMPILANVSGVVLNRAVNQGDYVKEGQPLFIISDLSRLWALFDVYESDLSHVHIGDEVTFTAEGVAKQLKGKVSFIDPILDGLSRTVKARVEINNHGGLLKPGMYVTAVLHPVMKQGGDELWIPESAVLWTGQRSVVYVKTKTNDGNAYIMREVRLGPSSGGYYMITEGLNVGDEVVTNGAFAIDAAAQLEGKPNMMSSRKAMDMHMHGSAPQESQMMDRSATNTRHVAQRSLMVMGMCESCKVRIEAAAMKVKGVKSALWSEKTHQLQLDLDTSLTDVRQVSKAVAAVGHDTPFDKSDQKVYDNLPECCKYR